MNERKYRHYVAWFNVNIKQINSIPDVGNAEEKPHDFRIQAPAHPEPLPSGNMSIVERLKMTAHRRALVA